MLRLKNTTLNGLITETPSQSVATSLKDLMFYGTNSWKGLIPTPISLVSGSICTSVKKLLYENLADLDPL
jgi:hypothetical protein